ncbi:ParB/RepB/Spo0J family partition protein [Sorangium sp. So ce388]|uniref:ParB/RepB/Spo0J family partition protein n=1 Tax=Sorangium sp. So ce388 TaxID=3133309 RepID=UPI003F5C92B7
MHAPVQAAECCATCGTPGVRTEAWVCGVCDARFTLHGEPVLSLDGLDTDLAAGGLYCESCDELRPPFERLACTGYSSPMRHIADVLDHQSCELDGRTWDGVPSGGLRGAPCRDAEEEAGDATMSIEGKSTMGNDPADMLEAEQPPGGAVTTADHRSPRSLHVPSEALPPGVNVRMVAIRNIVIPPNRVPDPSVVRQLKTSIADLGLLNPIILTPDGELVAGRNRIAACVALGYTHIEARIEAWGTIERQLAEIDENLVRRRLSVLERGRLLARRKELYEALYPEARQHARGGHAKAAADGATEIISPAPAFSTDAAAKLGTSERTVQEEIRIANDLAPEAVELILGAPLADEKVKLMELTRLPGEQQAAVARLLVEGRAKSVKTAVAVLQRSASQTDTPEPKPKSRVERTRPAPSGAGGLPSQGEELVITPAVPQGSMVLIDPARTRRLPAPCAEDLASTEEVEIDAREFVSIPRALADVRDKLRRSKPGRMNADLVSTVREFLTQIDRELRLHEAAATGRG